MKNDNMQDILKNYYAAGGKTLFETAEQLDEGPVGKALATAALALGLQFGNQLNAEEVYVYQDANGELKSVSSYMQVPDDTPLSYVIDTDTKQIKYLKQPDTSKVKAPAQSDDKSGKVLHGNFVTGMTIDQVMALAPGGKQKDEYKQFRGYSGGTVQYMVKGAPGSDSEVKTKTFIPTVSGSTAFAFTDGKLTAVHYVYNLNNVRSGPFKEVTKGEGLFGRKQENLPFWFEKAFDTAKNIIPMQPVGNARTDKGSEFGLGIGGVTSSGKGWAIGMDKVGSGKASIKTTDGQFTLQMRTQSGMANTFHIMGIMITKTTSSSKINFSN